MSMLEKLIAKKKLDGGAEPMDPIYKDSKMSMLKELRNNMSGMMKDDLSPVKKVEVSANDEDALATGLDKAKELVTSPAMEEEDDEDTDETTDDVGVMEMEESGEPVEKSMAEYLEAPTTDNIDDLIAALQKKRAEMDSGEGEMNY